MVSASRVNAVASRVSLRAASAPNIVCHQCCRHASASSYKQLQSSKPLIPSRYYASFTNRVRKKIWGTENPPGPEDPYGGQSVLDQRKRQQDLKDEGGDTRVQVAPTPEELEDENNDEYLGSDYVAKTTWDGMERVGYEAWGREEWDKSHPFEGYMNLKITDRPEIISAIHRALVEVYTLKQEGLPLKMDYFAFDVDQDYARRIAEGSIFESDAYEGTRVVVENNDFRQQILKSLKPKGDIMEEIHAQESLSTEAYIEVEQSIRREVDAVTDQDNATPHSEHDDFKDEPPADNDFSDELPEMGRYHILGGEDQIQPADSSWLEIVLDNPQVKFAVLKRVMQLTGTRIPDPDIADITDTRALLRHLVRTPKAKRLADSLVAVGVAELPNVQIVDRRYTPIDKEKEVGRWKVIERELMARGLPVTGSDSGSNPAAVTS